MTILKVTVEDTQADELKRLLHDIAIVKSVEEEKKAEKVELNAKAKRIKEILELGKGKGLFNGIKDPVEWQRNIRKEWDRDF